MFRVIDKYRLLSELEKKVPYKFETVNLTLEQDGFIFELREKAATKLIRLSFRETEQSNREETLKDAMISYLNKTFVDLKKDIKDIAEQINKNIDGSKGCVSKYSFLDTELVTKMLNDGIIECDPNNSERVYFIEDEAKIKKCIAKENTNVAELIWLIWRQSQSDQLLARRTRFLELLLQLEGINPFFFNCLPPEIQEEPNPKTKEPSPERIGKCLLEILDKDIELWDKIVQDSEIKPKSPKLDTVKTQENDFFDKLLTTYMLAKRSDRQEINLCALAQIEASAYCQDLLQSFLEKEMEGHQGYNNASTGISVWIIDGVDETAEKISCGTNGQIKLSIPFKAWVSWQDKAANNAKKDFCLEIFFGIFSSPAKFLKRLKDDKDKTANKDKTAIKTFSKIKCGLNDFFEIVPTRIEGIFAPFPLINSSEELGKWLETNITPNGDIQRGLEKLAGWLSNINQLLKEKDIKIDMNKAKSQVGERLCKIKNCSSYDLQTCYDLAILMNILTSEYITNYTVFQTELTNKIGKNLSSGYLLTLSEVRTWIKILELIDATGKIGDIVYFIMGNQLKNAIIDCKDRNSCSVALEWIDFVKDLLEKPYLKGVKTDSKFFKLCLGTFHPVEDIEEPSSTRVAESCLDFLNNLRKNDIFETLKKLKLPQRDSLCSLPDFRKATFACFSDPPDLAREQKINICLRTVFSISELDYLTGTELFENFVEVRKELNKY